MNKHILIVTSLLAATALQAQEIKVKDKIVEKSDNALIIGMTFDFGKVKVPADRSLVCTPVVVSGDSIRPLTRLFSMVAIVIFCTTAQGVLIRHTGNMNCVVIMVRNNSSNTPLAHQWRLG